LEVLDLTVELPHRLFDQLLIDQLEQHLRLRLN
jgi:hypothetical protein